ncbi:MAG: hypothetical protein ACXAD7_18915 [Candidatus Kariarchaeaceae archaeon]|jgi:hypothetical protein
MDNNLVEKNHHMKLWELPEWKKTRERLLKDFCEQCGKKDPPFSLIHTKPFPKALQVSKEVRQKLLQELVEKGEMQEFSLTTLQESELKVRKCPECFSLSLRERKVKKPKYACNNCSSEFEEPIVGIDENDSRVIKLRNQFYFDRLSKFSSEIDLRYNQELERLRIWYLSGEDTATYCRSCAFQRRKGRILCAKCKTHYHSPKYASCFVCNSILCNICEKNRILRDLKQTTCQECKDLGSKEEEIDCIICMKNKVIPSQNFGQRICERCVLDGHWIEHE